MSQIVEAIFSAPCEAAAALSAVAATATDTNVGSISTSTPYFAMCEAIVRPARYNIGKPPPAK